MQDPAPVEETLRETQARVEWLEAERARRQAAVDEARTLRTALISHRQRAKRRGVQMLEGAQRGALRMVVLAVGCGALICGASALDATGSGVAIVVSFSVLVLEGLR